MPRLGCIRLPEWLLLKRHARTAAADDAGIAAPPSTRTAPGWLPSSQEECTDDTRQRSSASSASSGSDVGAGSASDATNSSSSDTASTSAASGGLGQIDMRTKSGAWATNNGAEGGSAIRCGGVA